MLDNNLKRELLKAYNNVSKASKVEFNQQNLNELVSLFNGDTYLNIMFKLLSCFNHKIYISVVSPGGGRAFFDKSITVGFCRYAFCFMAATSFSRRFQQ